MFKTQYLPIPDAPVRKSGPKAKYPFDTMEVGESFILPAGTKRYRSTQIYCSNRSTHLGKRFRCRELPNGDIQVWRDHDVVDLDRQAAAQVAEAIGAAAQAEAALTELSRGE
jgi:hypothetical protein